MGYRNFTDSAGVAWQIWDVIPRYNYTAGERRRAPREGDTAAAGLSPELFDRRSSGRAFSVPAGMSAGWLCFESSTEKRRLAPIPEHWERLAENELEELCRQAAVVAPPASTREAPAPRPLG